MARRWPAADQREQDDDGVKSLVRRAIILQAGVAELADAQDLKSWVPQGACGFEARPRHHIVKEFAESLDRTDLSNRGQGPKRSLSVAYVSGIDPVSGGDARHRTALSDNKLRISASKRALSTLP